MSYHAASGNITIVKMNREVEIWQLDSQFASYQSGLLDHVCLRERLVAAQVQVKGIEASIEKTDDGLRKQVSREMELKRSIADLEAKCTQLRSRGFKLTVSSGEREKGIRGTAN